MYKAIIRIAAAAIILSACGSNGASINNAHIAGESQQPQQTEVVQNTTQETSQPEAEAPNDSNESSNHEEWSSLPEYETIMKHIDHKDYSFKTVTDNDNNRILLLKSDGAEQYKTIFVKKTKRLKIIKLDGDKQIYNEILASR